ncbi:glycosyltransferase family 2 protein [Yoonia sp. 2307UL14-13]|uniref:glycosyltransferase family 2 protein n=1 Tax=Yoonia sp. 2307UL14-13 TaxID=3126506 RepID=UPI0030A6CE81
MCTWETVTTAKDTCSRISEFVAYHLRLGAKRVTVFLDDPSQEISDDLSVRPGVNLVRCDDDFWLETVGARPTAIALRQSKNATHAYHHAVSDWICHIDIDEFIAPVDRTTTVSSALGQVPLSMQTARLSPVEYLSRPDGSDTGLYKLPFDAVQQKSDVVQRAYPRFGTSLPSGFLSHLAGKVFVRTGDEYLKLAIHVAKYGDVKLPAYDVKGLFLAHRHAVSLDDFMKKFPTRMSTKSYSSSNPKRRTVERALQDRGHLRDARLITHLYTEMCTARPELVKILSSTETLVEIELNLSA